MAGPCADCGRVIDDDLHHGVATATNIAPHPFRMLPPDAWPPGGESSWTVTYAHPRDQRIAALEAQLAEARRELREERATLVTVEARLSDATMWCPGEFPCEASTNCAHLEREVGQLEEQLAESASRRERACRERDDLRTQLTARDVAGAQAVALLIRTRNLIPSVYGAASAGALAADVESLLATAPAAWRK